MFDQALNAPQTMEFSVILAMYRAKKVKNIKNISSATATAYNIAKK